MLYGTLHRREEAMVANRVLAALCVVLFASATAGADDQRPTGPERLAVIPTQGIDPDEAVDKVKSLLGHKGVMRIPLLPAVLVWGTEEDVRDLLFLLRPL
jgi:hypothetical protein